ncbi:MAG TPA: response regulator [Gemmatimonadales bacterium]|jgi:CheY-like chemotaxis protein|nr:response regulator [Gemmatimonadales bacterium]
MPSILLVDDDADIRMTLRDFLTGAGFVVHTARDGQHALYVLERMDPPDVILLDYKMPVMDGKQFLAVQRRTPRLENIPVVILSAATREWSGAHLEVDEVLSKPVDLEVLLEAVNRILAPPAPPAPEPASRRL